MLTFEKRASILSYNVFQITDILSITFWGFLMFAYFFIHHSNHKHILHYKFFPSFVVYKFSLALLFAAVYIFYYRGGDTVWYWDGAVKLSNLFLKDPFLYFEQMASPPTNERYFNYFDGDTGFPASWIYQEPDSFYVCKITSIFSLITLNSFFSMTMIFAFFSAISTWKLYEMVVEQKITTNAKAAIAILFIPSVSFWASGIMKDTIVLTCCYTLIIIIYRLFIKKNAKRKFWLYLGGIVIIYLIFRTRSFMLICLLPCLLIWVNYELLSGIRNKLLRRMLIPTLFIISLSLVGGIYFSSGSSFGSYSAENIVETAIVIQQDFQGNKYYSENRYYIGDVDGSPQSMLLVMPAAIIAAFYRPFVWEANTIFMFFSGLEGLFFMFLTLRFLIKFRIYQWIHVVSKNKFLMFALVFSLVLGYFVGFTGGIFGALVRFKTAVLPFLILVFLMEARPPNVPPPIRES